MSTNKAINFYFKYINQRWCVRYTKDNDILHQEIKIFEMITPIFLPDLFS